MRITLIAYLLVHYKSALINMKSQGQKKAIITINKPFKFN